MSSGGKRDGAGRPKVEKIQIETGKDICLSSQIMQALADKKELSETTLVKLLIMSKEEERLKTGLTFKPFNFADFNTDDEEEAKSQYVRSYIAEINKAMFERRITSTERTDFINAVTKSVNH